jgi:hypothetical protein
MLLGVDQLLQIAQKKACSSSGIRTRSIRVLLLSGMTLLPFGCSCLLVAAHMVTTPADSPLGVFSQLLAGVLIPVILLHNFLNSLGILEYVATLQTPALLLNSVFHLLYYLLHQQVDTESTTTATLLILPMLRMFQAM